MRVRVLILIGLWTAGVTGAIAAERPGWIDKIPPHQPGDYPALRRVDLQYRFGWSGLLAGRAEATFSTGPGGELRARAKGGTIGAVRVLWQLDAIHEATAHGDTLLPIQHAQEERYRGMTIVTESDFARESASVLREKNPSYGEVFKRKVIKIPDTLDLHTGYRYVRSQPLNPGDKYTFVTVASDSGFLTTVRVMRREKIKAGGVWRPAIRCELQIKKVDKKRQLIPYRKFKRATGWLSDDADRIPLRIEADIFVGKVWAEIGK